jgi:hypothetical protein
MFESDASNSKVGKTKNLIDSLIKFQRFSTLTFSIVLFLYITVGLFIFVFLLYSIIIPIFYSGTELFEDELGIEKLFWYLYQIIFISLSVLTLLSSINDIKNKKLWKTIIACFVIFLSWWAYYGLSAHGIRYSFIY